MSGKILRNRFVALYIVGQLQYLRKLFSYNDMGTLTAINKLTIQLPVTTDGEVDYEYIEARMRELEASRMRELEAYIKEAGLDDVEMTDEEEEALNDNRVYKEFSITDEVFDVSNAGNIMASLVTLGSGTDPYVTAGVSNNAIAGYISYDETKRDRGNVLLIGGKTGVVTYQPLPFYSNDTHNLILALKEQSQSDETINLFLAAAVKRSIQNKYSWGNSISSKKIKQDTISLPATPSGSPDFSFMRIYIRAVKKRCVAGIKAYIARERAAYEAVIGEE